MLCTKFRKIWPSGSREEVIMWNVYKQTDGDTQTDGHQVIRKTLLQWGIDFYSVKQNAYELFKAYFIHNWQYLQNGYNASLIVKL